MKLALEVSSKWLMFSWHFAFSSPLQSRSHCNSPSSIFLKVHSIIALEDLRSILILNIQILSLQVRIQSLLKAELLFFISSFSKPTLTFTPTLAILIDGYATQANQFLLLDTNQANINYITVNKIISDPHVKTITDYSSLIIDQIKTSRVTCLWKQGAFENWVPLGNWPL